MTPYFDRDDITIYHGDHLEVLPGLEPVDLVVTSPPYDDLRDYEGYDFDFEGLAKDLFRVVKKGGVVVWVVRDATINGNKTLTSFKQCLHFQNIGFNVYDVMIYSKTTGGLPHKGRYRDAIEYMFILSKGKPEVVHLIKDRKNKYGGTYTYGITTVREKNGTLGDRKQKYVEEYGYRYNIWEYAAGKGHSTYDEVAFQHPAIFPEQLANDHIISWSNENDIVLDPMCGSGTMLKMAKELGRKAIGIEIEERYCEIAAKRIEKAIRHDKLSFHLDRKERKTLGL